MWAGVGVQRMKNSQERTKQIPNSSLPLCMQFSSWARVFKQGKRWPIATSVKGPVEAKEWFMHFSHQKASLIKNSGT